MTKYTRREFFKSIIPVSVGVVSFLWKGFPDSIRVLAEPGETIPYEVALVGTREPTKDEIERGKELEDFFNQESGAFYKILTDK